MAEIVEVLRRHTDELMAVPGVVGVAEGLCGDAPCIIVFVVSKGVSLSGNIPAALEGLPVRVEESGQWRARGGAPT